MNRRDFLLAAGAALGGAILSGCGSGEVGPSPLLGPPVQNFSFISLLPPRGAVSLTTGIQARAYPGSAMVNDLGEVVYHAHSPNGKMELRRLRLTFQDSPVVQEDKLLLTLGSTLPAGRHVKQIEMFSLNQRGTIVVRVVTDEGFQALYRLSDSQITPVVAFGSAVDPSQSSQDIRDRDTFSQSIGDFELLDDDSLLVVAHYCPRKSSRGRQGLFLLALDGSAAPVLLAKNGDLMPESNEPIGCFGLIDGVGNRHSYRYTHQVFGIQPPPTQDSAQSPPLRNHSAVIQGNSGSARLAVADVDLSVNAVTSPAVEIGRTLHGPRLGRGGELLTIRGQDDLDILSLNGKPLLRTGQKTPLGRTITGFYGPTVSANGLGFVPIEAGPSSELILVDRQGVRSIAYDGMSIAGHAVARLGFGLVRNQVDSQGRIVFPVRFSDDSTGLVLGFPA